MQQHFRRGSENAALPPATPRTPVQAFPELMTKCHIGIKIQPFCMTATASPSGRFRQLKQGRRVENYQLSELWKTAFAPQDDGLDRQRNRLIEAFTEFRKNVATLVSHIHKDMPSLTVHDITHIDALWLTASEITGPDYPLNPAEAFVLGGAFLLHDAAHCVAAYPGGVEEIVSLPEWAVYCNTLKIDPATLQRGSPEFQKVLFEVLRALHPKQARSLAHKSWTIAGDDSALFLLPNAELRRAYGDVIGLVAESHWHHPHQLELLHPQKITPAACLQPALWTVDVLKLALILRTADAAHIDAQRAPRFLQALTRPTGLSLEHWRFQSRLNSVKRDADPQRKELCLSGSPFPLEEQTAWWLAFDAAKMIDSELRASERLQLDYNRPLFAVRSVAHLHSTESFAVNVPTTGWHPIDTSLKISNISKIVEQFGGQRLYGDDPSAALRELIQNARDAVNACRSLGGLGEEEGEIEVCVQSTAEGDWLHVTDTGIGMSRYVLTEVLLDFGKSLWKSAELRGEWQRLITSDFEAVGRFGIGFFSVFMLGSRILLTTRRYEVKDNESCQWVLDFANDHHARPTLRAPHEDERLHRHGTRVSVLLRSGELKRLLTSKINYNKSVTLTLADKCASLAPSLDIHLYCKFQGSRTRAVRANDWLELDEITLLSRVNPGLVDVSPCIENYTPLKFIKNTAGEIIGRIGLDLSPYYRPDGLTSAGVYRGILTGTIPGLLGILNTFQQDDLARNTATPALTAQEFHKWVNDHIDEYSSLSTLDLEQFAILARLGVDKEKIKIGAVSGSDISYVDFLTLCAKTETIALHVGRIDPEDHDDVSAKKFYEKYIPQDFVIETEGALPVHWLDLSELSEPRQPRSTVEIIEYAITQSWGKFTASKNEKYKVATVFGHDIIRNCIVYRKK
ncbi:ATP-binding protein [Pseudomonas sp. NPDC088890]|uniref:HD domain-containing protein n=1 Tax=Pseudomonas sp. NPDC088890 TaxID=3364458 RepID=UPI00384B18B3